MDQALVDAVRQGETGNWDGITNEYVGMVEDFRGSIL